MRISNSVEENLKVIINKALNSLGLNSFKEEIELLIPKDRNLGDLSTNVALKVAPLFKKNPLEIADKIVGELKINTDKELKDKIKQVINKDGFINFFFNNEYYWEKLRDILLKKEKFSRSNLGRNRKVLIEFVSANPTGPLSIAHARQAVVGDVLANVLKELGFKVFKEYYINDEGARIELLGKSVEARLKELKGEVSEFPQDGYLGDYIYDIAKQMLNEKVERGFSDYAVKFILKEIKRDLKNFGVEFDFWISQKKLSLKGKVEKAITFLKNKGFIYEKDGAVWFKSTAFGDDKDRVLIKKDKTLTYFASDIAYHQYKYKRGFDWLINLWGPDHHGYINRLKAAVKAMGKNPDSLSIIIVQLVTLIREGKMVPMSTRKATYITLREVLDEVGKDPSRFFFIMRRTDSHLDFDLDLAKSQLPQNPVYYIQYAHARIHSILSKADEKVNPRRVNYNLLKEEQEVQLLKTVTEFNYYLNIVLKTIDPYILTVYLQRLANDFHKFYESQRVLVEDRQLREVRLALVEATLTVLRKGLKLLGLSMPQRM
jgi:arginyl-tRNA synthetase